MIAVSWRTGQNMNSVPETITAAHTLSGQASQGNFPSGPKNGCGPSKLPIGT